MEQDVVKLQNIMALQKELDNNHKDAMYRKKCVHGSVSTPHYSGAALRRLQIRYSSLSISANSTMEMEQCRRVCFSSMDAGVSNPGYSLFPRVL